MSGLLLRMVLSVIIVIITCFNIICTHLPSLKFQSRNVGGHFKSVSAFTQFQFMTTNKSACPAFRKVDRRYLYLLGEFTWFLTLCALTDVTLRQFKISLIILVSFGRIR